MAGRGAGRRRSGAALDLDQAKPAGAEGIDHVGRAEFRDLRAGLHRRTHDRGALGHGDGVAVDNERHHRFGFRTGRAVVDFLDQGHVRLLFRGLQGGRCRAEIFPEVFEGAQHRVGRETAQRAERAELHGVAEVFDHGEVFGDALAADDLVDGLDASRRSDPAWRALAAGFDCAEFHRKARLPRHVDAVVEHHDAAMADQPVTRRKGFIVERRIEQCAGEVGAERTADLHRANRTSGEGAAADIVDQFAERDTESGFEQAANA